jgi:RES domain-containing protein
MATAYRISAARFAATMWSGIGARDAGGRWNSKGVPVVYTAESRSLATLEQLVHLVPPRVLSGFVIASVLFDDAQVKRVDLSVLPVGWSGPVAPASLRKYGDDWLAAGDSVVLSVPSAVVPGEWNYLINPAHPDFAGLRISDPEPFLFDYRLA